MAVISVESSSSRELLLTKRLISHSQDAMILWIMGSLYVKLLLNYTFKCRAIFFIRLFFRVVKIYSFEFFSICYITVYFTYVYSEYEDVSIYFLNKYFRHY